MTSVDDRSEKLDIWQTVKAYYTPHYSHTIGYFLLTLGYSEGSNVGHLHLNGLCAMLSLFLSSSLTTMHFV